MKLTNRSFPTNGIQSTAIMPTFFAFAGSPDIPATPTAPSTENLPSFTYELIGVDESKNVFFTLKTHVTYNSSFFHDANVQTGA